MALQSAAEPGDPDPSDLAAIYAIYTMHEERSVHDALYPTAQAPVTIVVDTAGADDDLDDIFF